MKIEILHQRDPDSACEVRVFIDGTEIDDSGVDYVSIDPGAGWDGADWDESAEWDTAPERNRSESFSNAISEAYDEGKESPYVDYT